MEFNELWESLDLSNDFIFGKVMRKPDLCKKMLETILDFKISHIEYPESQKSISLAQDARSVRLDVYVEGDAETVYNVEIQTTNTKELAKRSRYYQGMIDLNLIDKGELYSRLKRSYVIFLCTFDMFGQGRHKYTFENRCMEDLSLSLGDETTKIFLNTTSKENDVTPALHAFLDYLGGNPSEDPFVQELTREVYHVKTNEDWRREYMTLHLRDLENVEKGIKQGIERGEAKMILKAFEHMHSVDHVAALFEIAPEEVRKIVEENLKQ